MFWVSKLCLHKQGHSNCFVNTNLLMTQNHSQMFLCRKMHPPEITILLLFTWSIFLGRKQRVQIPLPHNNLREATEMETDMYTYISLVLLGRGRKEQVGPCRYQQAASVVVPTLLLFCAICQSYNLGHSLCGFSSTSHAERKCKTSISDSVNSFPNNFHFKWLVECLRIIIGRRHGLMVEHPFQMQRVLG